MCGIAGYLKREELIHEMDVLNFRRAVDKLAHRGPDSDGVWRAEKTLLGHRRLSIIDLSSAGRQPFELQERGQVITFNGEIYNYLDIRSWLAANGYQFRSNTDTEVLLNAFDHYGMGFLPLLRGMFAFCIVDARTSTAVLARDPAGEKPLYYYLDSDKLVFASEIKAFHAFPELDLSLDERSIKAFFELQYIPGTHTVYKRIKKVPQGGALLIDMNTWQCRENIYWSFENAASELSVNHVQIEDLLFDSVRYRLIADVEIGVLLSGGIDSTLLALCARETGANLRVFSAAFDRSDLDESRYSSQVSKLLGVEQVFVNGGELDVETFEKIVFHADEPLGDPACVPTYSLARELSQYVRVVLSGEGADELFWGYDIYRLEAGWAGLKRLARMFAGVSAFKDIGSHLESSTKVPGSLTRLFKLLTTKRDLGAARWTTVFSEHTVNNYLLPAVANQKDESYLHEMECRLKTLQKKFGYTDGSLNLDLLFWLPDDLLVKADRMMMAHGVEARSPFLDTKLIAAALAMPKRLKLGASNGKLVLRHLLEKKLPGALGADLAWRRKHGFEVPVGDWLRKNIREKVEDQFSARRLGRSGMFNAPYVINLWKSFLASPGNHPVQRKLWLVLCFQSWLDEHERHFGFSSLRG